MTSWKTKYMELKKEFDILKRMPMITDKASFNLGLWDMEIGDTHVFLTLKKG